MERFTVRLRDSQAEIVSELRRASVARDDVPEVSESAVIRELFDHALHGESALTDVIDAATDGDLDADADELGEALLDLVPEHTRVEHERERVKRENRVADLRGGFRGRVSQAIRTRFENGYEPADLRSVAEGYKAEARVLWPRDEEARQRAVDHVNEELAGAVEAAETSDHDPASTDYERYSGVEETEERERQVATGKLVEDAERLLSTVPRGAERSSSSGHQPAEVVAMLAGRRGVTEEDARRAVREAGGEPPESPTTPDRARADGGEEE